MRLRRVVLLAHRWVGLLLGVQVVFWMASGAVMSWLSLKEVRGETTAPIELPPRLEARQYASPGGIIAQWPEATEVRLRTFSGALYYEAIAPSGRALFDPFTGEPKPPLDEAAVKRIAQRAYVGDPTIHSAILLSTPPPEYKGPTPVWQVRFSTADGMRLYISPDTGEVLKRRNNQWRLFDFFWMLHIMDYDERENFNHPLIRIASATGLAFALTGVWLVGFRLLDGRYRVGGSGSNENS